MRKPPAARPASVSPQQVREVDRRLRRAYAVPQPRPSRDLLGGLVATILSQHTSAANSSRAYSNLRRRFARWSEVARASEAAIAQEIGVGGLSRAKSRWIRELARNLSGPGGRRWLGSLAKMAPPAALERLTSLPGVGLKTAACVLLFDLGKPVFPVDTHVHRIARRLGWLPPKTTAEATCLALDALVPSGIKYSLHINMVRHGRGICLARAPRCALCPIEKQCKKVGLAAPRPREVQLSARTKSRPRAGLLHRS